MVTEMPRHSALRCVSSIRQNNAKPLISNGLRFVVTCLLTAALWVLFHGLRHTFATRCIESQCDYKTGSAILGHSNVATTLNLYVHPNIHQKKKCIERMNKFLGIAEQ